MKIGLFGGSFNPIHERHMEIIKDVLKKGLVDEVWIVPCKKHPFNKTLASEKSRLEMIKLATKNIPRVRISKIELKSKGKSYTLKTSRKLKKKYRHDFFLVVGSDVLYEIKKWYKYEQLLRETRFILFKRKDYLIKKIKEMKIICVIGKGKGNISSTEIRKKIKSNKPVKNLIPRDVEKYIQKTNLYK